MHWSRHKQPKDVLIMADVWGGLDVGRTAEQLVVELHSAASDELPSPPTVSVVICAYTVDRWLQLKKSVASVEAQTSPPIEIILCIDHNEELLRRSEEYFEKGRPTGTIPLVVLANKYNGHLGSARNTAAEFASGKVLAFLDDDAAAAADWLERLIAPYDDDQVGAVGGAPLPVFESRRPRWFPYEFDWVFGCAYRGLPLTHAPLAHLIGANMSVRRSVLREIGGFHSDDHDDMDMCHRIAFAQHKVLYEPLAVVYHFVPVTRTTWHYFWRRCYLVNQGKVEAFANMREAASLGAELAFVARALTTGVLTEVRQVIRGDSYGLARVGAMTAGIALAGLGHLSGKLRLHWSRRLRRSQRLTSRAVPTAQDAPGRQSLAPRWWRWPTSIRVASVRPEFRQLKSPAVTSWSPIDGSPQKSTVSVPSCRR
jgi:glucosyl-dolichyl phosphate glucuronosyltransferase